MSVETQDAAAEYGIRARTAGRLKASIVRADKLSATDRARMFALMQKYYDGVTEEIFLRDLYKKNHVILLIDDSVIQGFSTLATVDVVLNGKRLRGIFSGDTVIEKDYWGRRALGKAFLRYLFSRKLRRPFSPLYWLLISKGYKTYLLMANNFSEHYPRYEKEIPVDAKRLIDGFYSQIFGGSYDRETGLIRFTGEACRLKPGVAVPSEDSDAVSPRIAFFERVNPGWRDGAELACIARMTLLMPVKYAIKSLLSRSRKCLGRGEISEDQRK